MLLSPKTMRQNQEADETQEASRETSSTPPCNMGLNLTVSEKGTLAVKKNTWLNFNPINKKYMTIFTGNKARKGPVDPTANNNHGQHICNIYFKHITHSIWISHQVSCWGWSLLGLEVTNIFTDVEMLAHQKSLLGQVLIVLSQKSSPV